MPDLVQGDHPTVTRFLKDQRRTLRVLYIDNNFQEADDIEFEVYPMRPLVPRQLEAADVC